MIHGETLQKISSYKCMKSNEQTSPNSTTVGPAAENIARSQSIKKRAGHLTQRAKQSAAYPYLVIIESTDSFPTIWRVIFALNDLSALRIALKGSKELTSSIEPLLKNRLALSKLMATRRYNLDGAQGDRVAAVYRLAASKALFNAPILEQWDDDEQPDRKSWP